MDQASLNQPGCMPDMHLSILRQLLLCSLQTLSALFLICQVHPVRMAAMQCDALCNYCPCNVVAFWRHAVTSTFELLHWLHPGWLTQADNSGALLWL
jgi:hypothetical protein